jgi:predicted deacetylase
VLIRVVSFALQSLVELNIYNQCKSINLTSPVYFMSGGKWNVVPEQEIDVNTVMRNCIELDSGQDMLEGALVYRIQAKKHTESDKTDQDELKHIWLLVA